MCSDERTVGCSSACIPSDALSTVSSAPCADTTSAFTTAVSSAACTSDVSASTVSSVFFSATSSVFNSAVSSASTVSSASNAGGGGGGLYSGYHPSATFFHQQSLA